jgi:hypothetical protein
VLADGPSKLKIGPSCEAAANGGVSAGGDKEACLGDELAAQETLAKKWGSIPLFRKPRSVTMTTQGGPS